MNSRISVTSYNDELLNEWQTDFVGIVPAITEQKAKVNQVKAEIARLEKAIFPLTTQINRLNTDIARRHADYDYEQANHFKKDHDQNSLLDNLGDLTKAIAGDPILNSLDEEKKPYCDKRARLESLKETQESILAEKKTFLRALKARKKFLEKELPKAQTFLADLRNQPEHLFRTMLLQISNAFQGYDEKHFEQDKRIRSCLCNIEEKLATILTSDMDVNTQENSNYREFLKYQNQNSDQAIKLAQKEWRLKYARLCGFMWDLYFQYLFLNNHPDQDLLNVFDQLLNEFHVDNEDDLPNEMHTGLSCQYQFVKFKKPHEELYQFNDEATDLKDFNDYQKALIELRKFNDVEAIQRRAVQFQFLGYPELCAKIFDLANSIEAEVALEKSQLNHSARIKYDVYAKGINACAKLCENPADLQAQDMLTNVAAHIQGKPSVRKQILGGFLGVLGLILCAGSIAAFIVTQGASADLSAKGFHLGVILLINAAPLVSFALNAGLTKFGVGLFNSGCRQGLSQKVMDVKDHAQKPVPTPRPSRGLCPA